MLFDLKPGMEGVDRVPILHLDRHLGNDRPVVDLLIDEMHRDTGDCHTVIESTRHGSGPREGR